MGYGGRGDWKDKFSSSFEGAIPLILILVLATFVAGKFGIVDLSVIPGVGALFPAATIKVVCVGECSSGIKMYLQSDEARMSNIMFQGELSQDSIYGDILKNYDIIILQNERYCNRLARQAIRDRIKQGGKLIVIGDACTRMQDDASVLGWGLYLQEVIPAVLGGVTADREVIKTQVVNGEFKIIDLQHPIFGGDVPGIKNFPFNARVTKVNPGQNSKVLSLVVPTTASKESMFAVIEGSSLMGKTLYFAYDPGVFGQEKGRTLFLNAIYYLKTGRAG